MTSRPSTAPDFLLSRAHGSVRTQGASHTFTDPFQASAALKARKVPMVVGALPFCTGSDCALKVPESIVRTDGPLEPPAHYRLMHLPEAKIVAEHPSELGHFANVDAAIGTIRNTQALKIVLARSLDVEFSEPVDPRLIAAKLIMLSPDYNGFLADISTDANPKWLVGSSPEVLVRRQGSTVTCYPLAGSAPRNPNKIRDRIISRDLLSSMKDLDEHRYVVEHIRAVLAPLCSTLTVPDFPELTSTAEMWHLATPISGTLKDPKKTNALDLALLLHPTPAICGTPRHLAETVILEAEPVDRGFYAGAVGWCDDFGDGEYMVAIRCAETDGKTVRTWAGGGLVGSSDPAEEVQETTAKLRTILRALGLDH
ncbi:isochorismate synthase [Corynebacterium felinum]|uniref:isochorismate synthase n=1 Tax=Corynebacterium felinum TaxID=131318 RepID=A0ABU2B9V5_9CORY|nr:isochorismate synthase [Corynebacterium felinum]MDF5821781.1 isochorismate synthase [Corynebacterium felinum]MDR7355412.1 isochorismate synthase [Corynebacterium felinum]WJY94764.1 Isochorismate synthase DhbC [Corynebacterium felinum]